MRHLLGAMILGLAALVPAAARAQDEPSLGLGDKAPALSVAEWVKGEPVASFEAGKLYVVEFWATWCGPCKVSIPHLTELQKKHPEVTFIGVSVWEDDPSGVKPFVEEMGDKMDYRVATDTVPEGKSGNEGAMAQAWMQAAGENGIPAAFVVDEEGTIVWIGHPMELEKPLGEVVAGTWDVAKAKEQREKAAARQEKLQGLVAKLQKTDGPADAAALLPDIDALIADDPELAQMLGGVKLSILLATDPAKAAAQAEELAAGPLKEQAMPLNNIAWSLIDPDSDRTPTDELKKAALKIARQAAALSEKDDANILDTLGWALFLNGETKEAIEVQKRAVKAAGDDADPGIAERLKKYEEKGEG